MNGAQKKILNSLLPAIAIMSSQEDHEAHEVMLAIQTHDKMSNPDRYSFGDCRVYMRTTQEMLEFLKIIRSGMECRRNCRSVQL